MSNEDTGKFTAADMVAGMCLWEAFLALTRKPVGNVDPGVAALHRSANDILSDEGSFTVQNALVRLVVPCMAGWSGSSAERPDGPSEFDWEWCPKFVRTAMTDGSLEAAISAEHAG